MNLILLFLTLELSYTPVDTVMIGSDLIVDDKIFNIVLTPEFEIFEFIRVYGSADIKMLTAEKTFKPVSLDSKFNIELYYKMFTLGFEHKCLHPIITNNQILVNDHILNESYNRFYLRFSTKDGI